MTTKIAKASWTSILIMTTKLTEGFLVVHHSGALGGALASQWVPDPGQHHDHADFWPPGFKEVEPTR